MTSSPPFDLDVVLSDPFHPLPEYPSSFISLPGPRAPKRPQCLNKEEKKLAVSNVLRYVPSEYHSLLAPEFAKELDECGHIYAFRFCPPFFLQAPNLYDISSRSQHAAGIILMILNNLDPRVAQFPRELVTYGGNGQAFSNWLQFRVTIRYLVDMSSEQTLVLYSGHPLGLFPSQPSAPRLTITNGMMIPNYSTKADYDKFFALGVTQYGQMTAGSFCYIGPQGIVHGTTITVINAGRRYLGVDDLAGKVFVTSGLGGMSGAQPKAAKIAGCIGVVAEVNRDALEKRKNQGWLDESTESLDELVERLVKYIAEKKSVSIGYLGNVVDLWERLANESELLVHLGSDQTSLHNPYQGGYYPAGLSYEESNEMLVKNPVEFKKRVQESLRRQITAIDKLTAKGMHFWDYGNAFLVECHRAGVDMLKKGAKDDKDFRYPSYMQDIMGDIFSMGFGPFRWVCTSGLIEDLKETDKIACEIFDGLLKDEVPDHVKQQYQDNKKWITEAQGHKLVVGTKARILYSDQKGRIALALAFNEGVNTGRIKAPVIISRDHHDVSGTDSPFRETSNITDGSAFTADMAVQNVIGDSFRGATWVSLHNGGGVGWGDVMNGGFGLILDGTESARYRAQNMLVWDVANGVTRRSWSGNEKAKETIERTMRSVQGLRVTVPQPVDPSLIQQLF